MELMTTGDAARALSVTAKTVRDWVKKGILLPVKPCNRRSAPLFKEEDVEVLRDLRRRRLGMPEVATMALQAHISSRETERAVRRLLDILGANVPVLLLDAEGLRSLKGQAKRALAVPWEPTAAEVLDWSRTFYALGEEHFLLLELTTKEEEPWRVFTELAKQLGLKVAKLAITDKEMDLAYGYLNMARRSLRDTAYLYVRSQHGRDRAAKAFPLSTGDPHEEVLSLMFPSS
jgi:DNA-binding transcriptional MerR regulator